jgi:hypothetical protein
MALAHMVYRTTVTLVDAGGNKSEMKFTMTSATMADALSDAQTIVAALNPLTDAVITGYAVSDVWEDSAVQFAAGGVQVEEIALISARIDTAQEKYAILRIPAPVAGLFQATTGKKSNVVLTTYAALITYLSLCSGATPVFTVSEGEKLADPTNQANLEGKRIHRGSRKG